MISALLYLVRTSWRNRFITRFKRLKQPKYLFGAVIGLLYFYWFLFRNIFLGGGRGKGLTGFAPWLDAGLFETLGAAILLIIVITAWLLPGKRAALTFSEAEIAFLFPAPLSRKSLIHFKLLRSQFAIFVTVFFLTLLSARSGSLFRIAASGVGWWLILSTLQLHFLGSSLQRTRMLDCGLTNWKRRLVILGLITGVAAWVMIWARQTMPALQPGHFESGEAITDYFQALLNSGPLHYLLMPFRFIVRPYLSADWSGFLLASAPALLILVAHYVWVIRSNVAFEEASIEASRQLAEKVAAVRSGNWQSANAKAKPARSPFRLSSSGPALIAFLWKNLIGAGSVLSLRLVLILIAIILAFGVGLRGGAGDSGWPTIVAAVASFVCIWSLFIGPQLLRQDFRRELPQMDMLKVLPLPGWQIALGQILTPVVLLTVAQWLLVLIAVVFGALMGKPSTAPGLLVGVGIGAAMVLPFLNLISLIIPNAAVLLFPSWFQSGKDAPHGIEATGQRLIFALGQFLTLLISVLPAAAVFTLCFLLFKLYFPPAVAIPVGAAAAAVMLSITGAGGVFLLGKIFNKFDLSSENSA
jgi:hypothetical protein